MLLRLDLLQCQLLAYFQRRQLVLERLVFFVLAFLGLLINLEEAFKLQHRSGHAEDKLLIFRFGFDIDARLIEHGRHHLRRDKALPDQFVNFVFVLTPDIS